jgi:hypothetical protein
MLGFSRLKRWFFPSQPDEQSGDSDKGRRDNNDDEQNLEINVTVLEISSENNE